MPDWLPWVIAAAVVIIVVVVAFFVAQRRRSTALRDRFGPEYDRTMATTDGRREGERELRERQERRKELEIRPLAPDAQRRYVEQWRLVQERFVDDPTGAIAEADRLVTQVMRDRGYPMDDFEQRAADVSVDHPNVAEDYRRAHEVAVRRDDAETDTEDLRRAMIHYRALFTDLLETSETEA
ncbi:MAG TPA: hypothetical protein VG709_03285 [Actinomycetota bacterium]|nr:hypothetical protein [Actinomycetota bacterium]